MVGISTQVVQARSELAEKQAVADRISQLVAAGNPADVAQIVSSPLIMQLRTQQAALLAQQADLNSKYGPLHPKMQATEEQKRDLDAKIAQEVGRLAASAANDVMVARAHLNSLKAAWAAPKARRANRTWRGCSCRPWNPTPPRPGPCTRPSSSACARAKNLDDVQTPESRIISSAAVPLYPTGPSRMLIVGAALPLGLLLGILAALLVEKLGPLMPVRVNGAPRAALVPPAKGSAPRASPAMTVWNGPPILGEINDPAQLRAADFVLDYPASKYSHAMAALVRELEARPNTGGGGAVIALTSADNGESRSAIAVSLARAASRMGKKAIIVDCAPQRLPPRRSGRR